VLVPDATRWAHLTMPSASTMYCASTAVDFVEDMAQNQIKYETIFGEQAEVLRSDLPKFEAAMAQLQKSPLVAKHGQR
jgi:hypothetical protein